MSLPTDKLILASASPRRQELLRQMGVAFEVQSVDIDETPEPGELAEDYVLRLAQAKARAVQRQTATPAWVLGADTAVIVDQAILGKPTDVQHARQMLQNLSGRSHRVLTGVALCGDSVATALSDSTVWFRRISKQDIDRYCASGEPYGKAGGYAIQGKAAVFIKNLQGSFSGVMGLPVYETARMLQSAGIRFWLDGGDGAY